MKKRMVFLFLNLFFSAFPSEISLGSGHRGLCFARIIGDNIPHYTVILACDLDPGFPLCYAYLESSNAKIIIKETLTKQYRKKLPSNFFSGGLSYSLFSLSKNKAFNFDTLYTIEDGHIRIYPGQAQCEARKVYQLSENQIFLGAFENRHYWWTKNKPREFFFKENNHTFKYTLHKRVTEPLGIAKGDPKGDLALRAVVKPKGWYPSPRTFEWIILNLKEAKQID